MQQQPPQKPSKPARVLSSEYPVPKPTYPEKQKHGSVCPSCHKKRQDVLFHDCPGPCPGFIECNNLQRHKEEVQRRVLEGKKWLADREIWEKEETKRRDQKYQQDSDQYTLTLAKFNAEREKKGDNHFVGSEDFMKELDVALTEETPQNRGNLLNAIVAESRKRRAEAITPTYIDISEPPLKKQANLATKLAARIVPKQLDKLTAPLLIDSGTDLDFIQAQINTERERRKLLAADCAQYHNYC